MKRLTANYVASSIDMKALLLCISCLFMIETYAQPTINNTHMPLNGDTLRYSLALPDSAVLASFNNAGTNQNWQFGNLVPNRQGLAEYTASAQTPYNVSNRTGQLLTDTLNLGVVSVFDVYDFYSNSAAEYALDFRGVSFPNPIPIFPPIRQAISFIDKDEIFEFPLNYLDRDSSTFNFGYRLAIAGLDTLGSAGYRINEVEAWGNITTPYGTFQCIKVKTDIVSYDTVSFGATSFGLNNHQREYKWLSPQLRFPVATLSGNVVAGVFVPGNIQYRDSARSGLSSIFAPFALFDADTTIIELGDTVQFNNNTLSITPATYQWSISPSSHTFVNGTNSTFEEPSVQFNALGFYDVQLIAQNNSGRDTLLIPNYIEVRQTTGITELKKASSIKVYPNPIVSGEKLIVKAESAIGQVWIFDQQGRLLMTNQAKGQQKVEIDLLELDLGLYFLQIDLNGNRITKKVVVH